MIWQKRKLHSEEEKEKIRKSVNKKKEIIRQKMKMIRQGNKNPNWRGGNREYWAKEARKILEQQGINMKGLAVHHKDGNWKNNNLENLEALTFTEHLRVHNFQINRIKLRP